MIKRNGSSCPEDGDNVVKLKNWLETPRVIFDSVGNGYWQEVTTRQHDIARRLGYPDAYREIPDWFKQ